MPVVSDHDRRGKESHHFVFFYSFVTIKMYVQLHLEREPRVQSTIFPSYDK